MVDTAEERRLAAILAADVVGYSRLMGQDESGTLMAVRLLRADVIEPKIAEHKGRLFKAMGDGFLAEFPSVVNAVACAAAIQKAMTSRNADLPEDRQMNLRIGVHLGDVIAEGGDVFGDGVNVAARIESLAPPGGVAISAMVHDHTGSRLDLAFEDIGEQQLKNIARPMRVYRLAAASCLRGQVRQPETSKPSIAVLPFTNMSGDPEQEYFADGMVEDIITALSRFKQLFVIARNSSFTYKGKAVDIKQAGRELGVRYVLEGSVRKAANRLRITAQLIDAESGAHLWAERYDGNLEDVFDLQDQVTARVVGAISPRLELAEIESSRRKSTKSLSAYDHYLRGMAALNQWTSEGASEALSHFYRAIELDPSYAAAYGRAAGCFTLRMTVQSVPLDKKDMAEAERLARLAAELGSMDDVALADAGNFVDFVLGDHRSGMELIERALALNPNNAESWRFASWAKQWDGQFDVAIDCCLRTLKLSPQDPSMFQTQTAMAFAHFSSGRYDEALAWAEKALSGRQSHSPALQAATACLVMLGRQREAEDAARRLMLADPAFTISNQKDMLPYRNPEHLAKWKEAYRKAGLTE